MRQFKITKSFTNRDDRSLDTYLQEISKIPILTINEEVTLCRQIKQGDEQALKKLIVANLRFVVSVAKQYQNQGLSLPDLINEGSLGLMKAANRFDETRGFKFITYAVWWIRQTILQGIAEHSRSVRLPLNIITRIQRINTASNQLEHQLEREPRIDELQELLALTEDQDDIEKALPLIPRKSVRLDEPLSEHGELPLIDLMQSSQAADTTLIHESLVTEINQSLKILKKQERIVIELFFGLNNGSPKTLDEIGEVIHLTRERVRQIKEKALQKIRGSTNTTKYLRAYLE